MNGIVAVFISMLTLVKKKRIEKVTKRRKNIFRLYSVIMVFNSFVSQQQNQKNYWNPQRIQVTSFFYGPLGEESVIPTAYNPSFFIMPDPPKA